MKTKNDELNKAIGLIRLILQAELLRYKGLHSDLDKIKRTYIVENQERMVYWVDRILKGDRSIRLKMQLVKGYLALKNKEKPGRPFGPLEEPGEKLSSLYDYIDKVGIENVYWEDYMEHMDDPNKTDITYTRKELDTTLRRIKKYLKILDEFELP